MKLFKISHLIFSLILGAMLLYGGFGKFSKPIPTPTAVVIKAQKFQSIEQHTTLQKILYINGLQQTNYFWQFLGVMQIICGLLIISQVFTLFGAIMAFPIVINIFLFHLFLEFDEPIELVKVGGLLTINCWLMFTARKQLKSIMYQPKKLTLI